MAGPARRSSAPLASRGRRRRPASAQGARDGWPRQGHHRASGASASTTNSSASHWVRLALGADAAERSYRRAANTRMNPGLLTTGSSASSSEEKISSFVRLERSAAYAPSAPTRFEVQPGGILDLLPQAI